MVVQPPVSTAQLSPPSERILRTGLARAERALDAGEPLAAVLSHLTRVVELAAGEDVAASILVLDREGLLRNGASPKLPADYLKAIDRIRPHPDLGTCAAAAARCESIYTPDFADDGRWAELRHLPMSIGYVGGWSHPIQSAAGRVLGTFGTYFREKRLPQPEEVALVKALLPLAARAIESLVPARAPA